MSSARTPAMLLVDCSQRRCVLGLARTDAAGASAGAGIVARTFEPPQHAAREPFWDELRALLSDASLEPAAIGAVAVAVGPGGFTGLRVSIAFAKAVALARGIPAIPVPSAAVFAASDRWRGGRGPWLVALASKAGSCWASLVQEPSTVGAAGGLVDADAMSRLAAEAATAGGVLLADEHLDAEVALRAAAAGLPMRSLEVETPAFAAVSAEILRRGGGVAPEALLPIYAREPEAVTNWRERSTTVRR